MSDRAVRSGLNINLPSWARRGDTGFDPSTLSPPGYDDDFFQIRHFVKAASTRQTAQPHISENHTSPCKQFLPENDSTRDQTNVKILKPMGVDDGFKGPAAACGTSIVAMAQQMLRGKTAEDAVQPKYPRQRRNSKSLPASPLGSPDTRRRVHNRFFTNELLSTFFSHSPHSEERSMSPQPEFEQPADEMKLKLDVAVTQKSQVTSGNVFRPKPSELREMNFLSPTSL